jgi:eukaryotic-like serine/threonine-protein kinase
VTVRTGLRRSLPYAVTIIGGFLVAYLLVAFVVFPSGFVPGDAKVPNVTGMQYDEANKRLAGVGLKAQRSPGRPDPTTPKGIVLEQDPRPGLRAEEGATITLVVSTGQQVVAVPPIVGLTQSDAQAAIEAAGFELGQVVERPNAGPPGQVLESTPAGGSKVVIPASVSIVVSVGSNVALVPNVVGRSVSDAREVLQSAKLGVGGIMAPPGVSTAAGMVSSQNPAAGAHVATGSKVVLQIGPGVSGARPQ